MFKDKRCLLIADDEAKMVRALKDFLSSNNFHIIEAFDGEEALDKFYLHSAEIDLVLLDVMMPKADGFAVLSDIRKSHSLTPVIMLTARGEEYDQIKGFQYGADDYIRKPFSPSILMARIESILKRTGKAYSDEMKRGELRLNSLKRTVFNQDVEMELTKREFDLLFFLMANQSMIFSREQLLNGVWGYDFIGDVRTVDTHIKQLRTKLKQNSTYIKTVHRVGYKFEV